jgi:hypothetical protein
MVVEVHATGCKQVVEVHVTGHGSSGMAACVAVR